MSNRVTVIKSYSLTSEKDDDEDRGIVTDRVDD